MVTLTTRSFNVTLFAVYEIKLSFNRYLSVLVCQVNTVKAWRSLTPNSMPTKRWHPRGEYSIYPWVGRCGPAPHTLTLFKTNIADFPTLFKTELRFLIPWLRHLKWRLQEVVWLSCSVIKENLMCLVSMPKSTQVNINILTRACKNFAQCSSSKKRYPVASHNPVTQQIPHVLPSHRFTSTNLYSYTSRSKKNKKSINGNFTKFVTSWVIRAVLNFNQIMTIIYSIFTNLIKAFVYWFLIDYRYVSNDFSRPLSNV